MNKENDILKWLEGEMSLEDIKNKYPLEDFSNLEKMGFYSKQIEVPKIDAEQALADFKKRPFKKEETKVVPLNFKMFMKVAAVMVVLLTSSYFLFFNNTASYSTEIAQTETLQLPDNSEVILNAQSELTFNKKEWKYLSHRFYYNKAYNLCDGNITQKTQGLFNVLKSIPYYTGDFNIAKLTLKTITPNFILNYKNPKA